MEPVLKRYPHAPAHLFVDEQMYFTTASTLYGKPYLKHDDAKQALLTIIDDFLKRKSWRLDHWVILNNHYHLTCQSKEGKHLGQIMGNIHRKSAKSIRAFTDIKIEKKVWHNYWDRCVRDEREYQNCLNYMFWNPVKHGLASDPLEYRWSSFYWIYKEGVDVKNWEFLHVPVERLGFLPRHAE